MIRLIQFILSFILYYHYSKLETLQLWYWKMQLFDYQNHTVVETETLQISRKLKPSDGNTLTLTIHSNKIIEIGEVARFINYIWFLNLQEYIIYTNNWSFWKNKIVCKVHLLGRGRITYTRSGQKIRIRYRITFFRPSLSFWEDWVGKFIKYILIMVNFELNRLK